MLFYRAPTLAWLLTINVGLYAVLVLVALAFHLGRADGAFQYYLHKLALPARLLLLLEQPWSILTHMFLHDIRSFWHILFNMLWLYWMGSLFISIQPHQRLGWVYFLAGLAGAAGFVGYAWASSFAQAYAMGASAAVNGVILATVALVPYHQVFLFFIGPVALRWVGLIWLFLDFILALGGNEAVAIAHLCGSFTGILLGYAFRQGWEPEAWVRALRDTWSGPKQITQQDVDRILDKIHAKGLKSLTRREREILKRAKEKL